MELDFDYRPMGIEGMGPGSLAHYRASPEAKRRVLLVEDDELQQVQLCAVFRALALRNHAVIEVHTADGVTDAERLIKRSLRNPKTRGYDLILSDFHLEKDRTGVDLYAFCAKNGAPGLFILTSTEPLNHVTLDGEFWLPFLPKQGGVTSYLKELDSHLFGG